VELKTYKTIKLEVFENSALLIKLNRPKVLNAFNLELISEFLDALEFGKKSKAINIICITGEGKAFSAGGDLNAMDSKSDMFAGDVKELRELYRSGIQQIPRVISSIDKPIIAFVNGPAVGAGCDLACMCDLRLVSEKAIFKESFINLSLVSGDGGSFFLEKIVGYAKAMDLLLTGRKVDSAEALSIGLATQVLDESSFMNKCHLFVSKLLKLPQVALRMNKLGLKNAISSNLDQHLEYMSALQSILQRSEDHEDLVKKFLSRS